MTYLQEYGLFSRHRGQPSPRIELRKASRCWGYGSVSTCYKAALPNCFVNQTFLYIFIYCVHKSHQVQKIWITMKENIITFLSIHAKFLSEHIKL